MTRKYGKKRPAASAAAVAIFGSSTQAVVSKPTVFVSPSTPQSPAAGLADITDILENTKLENSPDDMMSRFFLKRTSLRGYIDDAKSLTEKNDQRSSPDDIANILEKTTIESSLDEVTCMDDKLRSKVEPRVEIPIPRTPAPAAPPTKNWDDVLAPGSSIQKIAEASYAEVFRITNPVGSSILKLLRLKVPTDPTSKRSDTAIKVETVVSEMRLMNSLTEIPGFVKFKDAHIVEGKPPAAFVEAYETGFPGDAENDQGNQDPDNQQTQEDEELGLGCAGDVLQYAFDMGWIREEDLDAVDSSRLSLRDDS
ncbi:hypothetical protein DID88_002112 [Monilinia fructigena]|uniref:Protein kinase domain-containing protein n=1 Tax=Monilinia fructigena TaxID=38457 RepID=A0A395IV96_9HELO|nr:hypothetical protein DID88_002112 [Monilinia fructigena]